MPQGFSSDTRPGAIWNVVVCGVICIAAAVFAVVNASRGPSSVAFAVAVSVLALCMEVYFVRRLLGHLRKR